MAPIRYCGLFQRIYPALLRPASFDERRYAGMKNGRFPFNIFLIFVFSKYKLG